jgi:hypothetical protein
MVNRRRALRLAVLAVVALVTVAAIGLLALPEILRHVLVWRLAATTGRTVTLAAVELDPFDGRLALLGLRVIDGDQHPVASVERLAARFSPRDLLRGHLRISQASLDAPTLRVVRTGPNQFNVSDLIFGGRGEGEALALTIERLTLSRGALEVEDRTLAPARTWRAEGVTVDAQDVSTVAGAAPGIVTVHAVAAGAPISLWITGVQLDPLRFHATVIARDIEGSLAGLYLPPASPLTPARGRLNVSGTIEHDASDATRIALDLGFAGVELERPGHDETFLRAPAVRVKIEDLRIRSGAVDLARLEVDGGTLVLEDARLEPVRRWQADGVVVEARGLSSARQAPAGVATARAVVAGSPVSAWITNLRVAPVELHATVIARNVDATLLRLYLPRALPATPEQGLVDASVHVDHDAQRGTRLGLDAALRDLEVRGPPHSLAAPAVRVTAEDIAFGAGVVTVGRAAITAGRLRIEDRTLTPPRVWPVQDLAVEASRLSSRPGDVQGIATARATLANAAVSAWLTRLRLDPLELHVTAMLRNVDLLLLRPYLPAGLPVEPSAGVVDASFQGRHTAADGTWLTGDVVLGRVGARVGDPPGFRVTAPSVRVTLADARRQGEAVSVGRVELSGSGVLADPRAASARFDVERLHVGADDLAWPVRGPARVALSAQLRDGSEVDVTGTAELTSAPPDVRWKTDLDVHLRGVRLGRLAAYVPAASGLRGRVDAALGAAVMYGDGLAAHVRGDARVSELSVTDAGHTPLSVRRVEMSGLDVKWPEHLAVATVRLVEPHALVERDRHGAFPQLARLPGSARPPDSFTDADVTGGASKPPEFSVALGELVVDNGRLVFSDQAAPAPVRFEVPRLALTARDITWPARAPARLRLDAMLPRSGTLAVDGTMSADPARVDVQVAINDTALELLSPYLTFPAALRGRVDARLALAGPLAPALALSARGDATLRQLSVSDGAEPVLTVERLALTGIDATWPTTLHIDGARVRRSWARIERDPSGDLVLGRLFTRAAGLPSAGSAPPAAPVPPIAVRLRQGVFEEGSLTILDGLTTPPARLEIAGARLAVQEFTWPSQGPLKLQLTSPTPGGGTLGVDGTLDLGSPALEARVRLEQVDLAPAQPYLPIDGRVVGQATGDLTLRMAFDPLALRFEGQASVQRFRLGDDASPLVTVGRAEAAGIEVDWPRRVAVRSVEFRRPRLLIERDREGDFRLWRLLTPRWAATDQVGATPATRAPASARPAAPEPARSPAPTIEIGTLSFARATARVVDRTTTPAYAEEVSGLDAVFTGLTTAPGVPARVTASGAMAGGSSFTLGGEFVWGGRPRLALRLELRDVVVPRLNPYLDKFTSWTATRGTLSGSAAYALHGTQVDARHDLVLRDLTVAHAADNDEVERRIGLPLGFLVSLMKDARGEIRLSVPVAGDLATQEFDFREAVWGAVRNLAIRLIALPFARVGSLFFTEDSRLEGLAIAPVVFEPGADRPGAEMGVHLDRITALLRDKPAMRLGLVPIVTAVDLAALRRASVLARLGAASASPAGEADADEATRREHRARWPDRPVPQGLDALVAALADAEPLAEEALRDLSVRRLAIVRAALARGGIAAERLPGRARRTTLVEATGQGRVEIDPRP